MANNVFANVGNPGQTQPGFFNSLRRAFIPMKGDNLNGSPFTDLRKTLIPQVGDNAPPAAPAPATPANPMLAHYPQYQNPPAPIPLEPLPPIPQRSPLADLQRNTMVNPNDYLPKPVAAAPSTDQIIAKMFPLTATAAQVSAPAPASSGLPPPANSPLSSPASIPWQGLAEKYPTPASAQPNWDGKTISPQTNALADAAIGRGVAQADQAAAAAAKPGQLFAQQHPDDISDNVVNPYDRIAGIRTENAALARPMGNALGWGHLGVNESINPGPTMTAAPSMSDDNPAKAAYLADQARINNLRTGLSNAKELPGFQTATTPGGGWDRYKQASQLANTVAGAGGTPILPGAWKGAGNPVQDALSSKYFKEVAGLQGAQAPAIMNRLAQNQQARDMIMARKNGVDPILAAPYANLLRGQASDADRAMLSPQFANAYGQQMIGNRAMQLEQMRINTAEVMRYTQLEAEETDPVRNQHWHDLAEQARAMQTGQSPQIGGAAPQAGASANPMNGHYGTQPAAVNPLHVQTVIMGGPKTRQEARQMAMGRGFDPQAGDAAWNKLHPDEIAPRTTGFQNFLASPWNPLSYLAQGWSGLMDKPLPPLARPVRGGRGTAAPAGGR